MNLQKIKSGFQKTINQLKKLEEQNDKAIAQSDKAITFHNSRAVDLSRENEEARRFRSKLEELIG